MTKILIVDNSQSLISSLARHIDAELGISVVAATSMAEAEAALGEHGDDFMAVVVGLVLEDASGMEIVDAMLIRSLPTIVFTGAMDSRMRHEMWGRAIVDYVIKDSPVTLDHVISLLRRLESNPGFEVLVAEGEDEVHDLLVQMLDTLNYKVFSARTGQDALNVAEEHSDLRIVLLGEHLGDMEPFELLKGLRRGKSREDMSILTVSRSLGREQLVNFIKYGANDHIGWPFTSEEFNCKVNHAAETLELFDGLQRAARYDYLTGISNHGFFMQQAVEVFNASESDCRELTAIVLDADKFKNINDTLGHHVGDLVLRELSSTIGRSVRGGDIFGRTGGEEFALLLPQTNIVEAVELAEKIREDVEAAYIVHDGEKVQFTISLGVAMFDDSDCSVEGLLARADKALYQAKESGRNRLMVAD